MMFLSSYLIVTAANRGLFCSTASCPSSLNLGSELTGGADRRRAMNGDKDFAANVCQRLRFLDVKGLLVTIKLQTCGAR